MINLLPKSGRQEGNLPLIKLPRQVPSGTWACQKKPPVKRRLLFSELVRRKDSRAWRAILTFVGFLFILAGVVTGVAEYYLLPRLEAERVADRLHPPLAELEDSLGEVRRNFGDLFTLVSGEEEPTTQTGLLNLPQFLEEFKGKVAGESAKFSFYDLLHQLKKDLLLIASSFSGAEDFGWKGKVAGTRVTQLEDETTTNLRQVAAKAQFCGDSVTASRNKLTLLTSTVPQRFPTPLSTAGDELLRLVQESERYLLEAEKTARYYEVVSAVQIELVPAMISLVDLVQDLYYASNPAVYVGKIDSLAATIDTLNLKVGELSDFLPSGMEKLHADDLTVFTLFSKLLAETKIAVSEDSFSRFDKAVAEFEVELEVLATRARNYELDFWQTTGLLKGYGELSNRYELIKAKLTDF